MLRADSGSIGDQAVESAALLVEFGVRDEAFTDEVMNCCPPIDWRVTEADCMCYIARPSFDGSS